MTHSAQPVLLFLAVAALSVVASNPSVLRAGSALYLPQLAASGLLFLVLGAGLGPRAAGLLAADALPSLSPLVALGLGLAGILVGLNLDPRVLRRLSMRAGVAALGECAVTFVMVAVPLVPLFVLLVPGSFTSALGVAALLGAAASVSSGHLAERAYRAGRVNAAMGLSLSVLSMLHDVAALAALAVGLALGVGAAVSVGFVAIGQALMVGALCGLLLAFLLRSTLAGSELMAVLLGGVALVSGGAAFLRLSTFLASVACGAVLAWVGGRRTEELFRMLLRVERPAYLLLLFVIGAHVNPRDWIAGGLAAAFVLLRGAGKIAGGRVAARLGGSALSLPPEPGFALLSQGAVALCIAIEYRTMVPGPASQLLLDITALGAILNELAGSALFGRALKARPARALQAEVRPA